MTATVRLVVRRTTPAVTRRPFPATDGVMRVNADAVTA